jgi:simple sugar transport system ATP-binding protein
MARGRLSPSIGTSAATVELIGEWMSGLWPSGPEDGPGTTIGEFP